METTKNTLKYRELNVTLFVNILFLVIIIWSYSWYIINYYDYVNRGLKSFIHKLATPELRLLGTFAIFLIGCFLYLLKKKRQLFYGMLETGFAMTSCYISFTVIQKDFLLGTNNTGIGPWIAILSSIYLVVRGVNNVDDGLKKVLAPFRVKQILIDLDKQEKVQTGLLLVLVVLFVCFAIYYTERMLFIESRASIYSDRKLLESESYFRVLMALTGVFFFYWLISYTLQKIRSFKR
ncbi:hypothetical protein [Tellurirhabdus bombi]|uniref:hypothetical protein n=1 Tax=Tellurirhabdus bombi TaxID=2907205 RepID=UPI001F21D8F0|nr:hypothetical protein [Tellurirhabdus bombi]